MTDFFVNNTFKFIKNNSNYNDYDLLKIRYGLEGVFLTVTKILIILLIGFVFNYLDIVLLTLLFFNILRFFAFGLHAQKSWHCLILSIIEFNILPVTMMQLNVFIELNLIIGFISIISFILFAPSDTEKRPLTNKRKRIIRKFLSIIVSIVYIFISLYLPKLSTPILCSLIIESIMVNPLSYKMLGLKYNNYKNKEVKK